VSAGYIKISEWIRGRASAEPSFLLGTLSTRIANRIFCYHRHPIPLRQVVVTSIDWPSEMVGHYAMGWFSAAAVIVPTNTRHDLCDMTFHPESRQSDSTQLKAEFLLTFLEEQGWPIEESIGFWWRSRLLRRSWIISRILQHYKIGHNAWRMRTN